MKHTPVVSLNALQAKPGVHLVDTTRVCFNPEIIDMHRGMCDNVNNPTLRQTGQTRLAFQLLSPQFSQ